MTPDSAQDGFLFSMLVQLKKESDAASRTIRGEHFPAGRYHGAATMYAAFTGQHLNTVFRSVKQAVEADQ